MNISDLINELQEILEEEGDLNVMSSSDYGDHANTEQLNNIEEIIAVVPGKSAYSGTGLCFPRGYEDDDREEIYGEEKVVVLRYTN